MYETIIIGAGIAGQTAAIYASRKRMDYLLLSRDAGGQFYFSSEIFNYPGIVQTTGFEFAQRMEEQLEFNGVKPRVGVEVQGIEQVDGHFVVITDQDRFETSTVIISTGAHSRKLGVPGETELTGRGVTYCAVCDGPLYAGKDIAIVGGGDSALEAVDFTHRIASKIYLINRREKFSAHEYLMEKTQAYENVEIIYNADTRDILGVEVVEGLRYEQDGQDSSIEVQGVIIEIGREPNTDFVKDLLALDQHGHIIVDCQGRTSVPGIFAAGDCTSGHEYQYVIAAGQGCMALLKAARYLTRT